MSIGMSSNNGSVAKRERATKNLQMALQGESPEHINRVLSLVVKFDIDPDEEFFLIFAAIGHLKVLVEDAPQEWQSLFKSFVEELGQWAELNTEHLKILASKTETIEHLALSCERLGNTLELLQVVSQEQTTQLKTLINLSTELKELKQELREVKEFKQEMKGQILTLKEEIIPAVKLIKESEVLKWSDKWGKWVIVIFGIMLIANTWGLWQLWNYLNQTQLRIEWANTKLGRIERKVGSVSHQK